MSQPLKPRRKPGLFLLLAIFLQCQANVLSLFDRRSGSSPLSVLHVMFNPSAAGTLREALRVAGRNEPVVALFDDFSFGPIDPPDDALRAAWVENELGYDDWDLVAGLSAPFWASALSARGRVVAWMSRRSAPEYANFLEWLSRYDAPCDIVDVSAVPIYAPGPEGRQRSPLTVISTGELPPAHIHSNNLWDLAAALPDVERRRACTAWQKLREENAPFRIIENGGLLSAPLTFFDAILLSLLKPNWQKAAMVVANAMVADMDRCVHQTGDIVLCARLRTLAEADIIESQGDLSDIHASEVRLPQ